MSQVNKSRIPLTDNSIIEQVGQTVVPNALLCFLTLFHRVFGVLP